MDNQLYGYEYKYLVNMQKEIEKKIIYKIIQDIKENNGLIKYLIQKDLKYKYRYIYIDSDKIINLIQNKFPTLIIRENDDRKLYYAIHGTDKNLRNQELIKLLIENNFINDDYKIINIPEYLETYDEVIKYYHLFK
jgi:hypothetical protein